MSHMPPFRLNVPNLGPDMPAAPTTKKRRKNTQAPIQPPPNVQDLLPPPLSGYGDTIVASNPFDDCPSNVNSVNTMARNPGGPPMGMGGPGPNMVMAGNMMYRPMCPNPPMGMGSPMMHSPNAHQMNNPMMMNGPRMSHMGPGPGPGHGPPHMMPSPNGPGPGGPMGPNMNMTGPPMHSPIATMGPLTGPGPGSGGPMGSPMGHSGPMNGGAMNSPMNGPPMGGPHPGHGPHGPHPPHGPHGGPGGPGNMPMSTPNGPIGPPMNNNFIMSPMNNMYSKPMPVSAGKVYPVDQPMVFNSQNPNAPPIYPCGVCHKEVHDNDQAILCESGCNFWFHRGCTGLTEAAFQLLTAEVYAEWVCDKCLQSKNIPLVKFKP
ncbi:protein pygopus [Anoplophora glabripennis]|uniref:protein pygopus n=1 Tax=Anoplophora glabripennis TaxID=217634 RepID=UPI0008752172|nr:protein pygopus [Anoplophora glabripennis]